MRKRIILLCTLFAFLLTGCGNESATSGALANGVESEHGSELYKLDVAPEDYNQAFGGEFVETVDGYYYGSMKSTANGNVRLIYFCPRGGDSFRPLCGKPNCRHEDHNCNAWYGYCFGYYDGALYMADNSSDFGQFDIVKMNMDGTDHRVVATLNAVQMVGKGYTYKFHHGKFYVYSCLSTDMKATDHLVAMDLSDYSITDYPQTVKIRYFSHFYKEKLYGTALAVKDPGATEPRYEVALIEMDSASGEERIVVSQDIGSLYATDTTLYYYEADLSKLNAVYGTEYEKGNPGFRELNLQSGEVRECGLPVENILSARYDNDYIYATSFYLNEGNDTTLFLLSRDYILVDQIDLTGGLEIAAVTSDRIFLNDANECMAYYLDKSQIGSGELKLIRIETVG